MMNAETPSGTDAATGETPGHGYGYGRLKGREALYELGQRLVKECLIDGGSLFTPRGVSINRTC